MRLLGSRFWWLLRRSFARAWEDNCLGFSKAAAYSFRKGKSSSTAASPSRSRALTATRQAAASSRGRNASATPASRNSESDGRSSRFICGQGVESDHKAWLFLQSKTKRRRRPTLGR